MLQIHELRANAEDIKSRLGKRGLKAEYLQIVDKALEADEFRRSTQFELDEIKSKVNKASKEIGQLFRDGKSDEANALKDEVSNYKNATKELEVRMGEAEKALEELLLNIPNAPHSSVPAGVTEADNEIYQDWTDSLPSMNEAAKPHWELAQDYGIIDFAGGVKITGSGFPVFRGKGARLERALINFFLDEARDAGYEEIAPPLMVNAESARGTGQLPDKEGQMYEMERDGFYLIPTAEVPVTNLYRDEIINKADLPIKLTGYTPCFRREAGTYGKEVRGLNRVHQFDKVEIVQIAHPDQSYEILDGMLNHVKGLLEKLELPYRILRLCGGDLGFTSALTFDFEVYSAAQQRWLEVSSVSNFETFQSNRMMMRFRDEKGKTQLVHTLNGSALALARIVAALLENNQTPDGIVLPKALHSYTGFELID